MDNPYVKFNQIEDQAAPGFRSTVKIWCTSIRQMVKRWNNFNSRETPMKSYWMMGNEALAPCKKSLILAGMVALMLSALSMTARAEDDDLSKGTKACLKCHDKEGEEKILENGEKLSLNISTKAYIESMHNKKDCEDCHEIDAKNHSKEKKTIKSKREYSLSLLEGCRDCHKKKFAEYEDSVHAALIKEGSKKAPICTDCHNPHTVLSKKIIGPISAIPCAKCHEDIFKAYSKDVHGLERSSKGKSAPICPDCHQAHGVKAASLGDGIRKACLSCHKDAVNQHSDWLPNAERHFEAISCPACHAPTAQRRVNLRLYDSVAKHQLSEKIGVPKFETRTHAVDANDAGLDERALWSLLKEFNQDGGEGKTTLRGRLEVRSGIEAHQLSEKSKAIKDCDTCHREGAEPFQSVTLTIAGPDGRPLRHGIQKEVLNSLVSMESVRGFYAIGGTRIKLLDTVLVLVLLGSIGGPLAHMTLKWLFRRARKHEAEKIAATPQASGQVQPGDRHNSDNASK
jgi:predicted CXXCH cytochrome family protein